MSMATTISVCALPLGGIAGSARIFPDVLQRAAKVLKEAEGGILTDSLVTHVADWLVFVMVHDQGSSSSEVLALKESAIAAAAKTAEKRRLFRRDAQQVLCGLSFTERESEPLVLFLSPVDRAGFWNPILLSEFADPFQTPSLAEGTGMMFCTEDAAVFQMPQDTYQLMRAAKHAAIIGVAADAETPVATAAGVVMISRAEAPYPRIAELCGTFVRPRVLPDGVVCPVSLCDAAEVAAGVIPVVALGFSVADGRLTGPVDLFDNPAFAAARVRAGELAGYR